MELSELKLNKKSLMHDLMIMDYSQEDAENELNSLIEWFNSLPNKLELYRIIYVDNENEINVKQPGSHYSISKEDLLDSHTYSTGYGELKYLITVSASKSLVDIQDTLSNNILYPNEREITLKNKGKGSKIISITPLKDNIQEESKNDLRQLLIGLINSEGVSKTLDVTGLDIVSLYERIGDIDIDSDSANTILELLFRSNKLTRKVNNFTLDWDSMDGVLYWNYKANNERFLSMCTPFWDGQNGTPINLSYYTYTDEYGDEHDLDFEKYIYIENEFKFKNIQGLINWFEKFYIPTCVKYLSKFIREIREELK